LQLLKQNNNTMEQLKINHGAVWVSVVLMFGLGFIWFGPLFGERWMGLVGLDMAAVEANPPGAAIWISNAIATVIGMYTLAWLFVRMNVDSVSEGAVTGLVIGFAFVFLSHMIGGFFAQAPYALAWINGGHDMAALTIAGAVLGGWRKYA
jgi:Protein of unknown function (DUF1761)